MSRMRAATTRLDPGQHSIDRVQPRSKDGVWLLDWSLRLPDGRLVTKRTQGSSKGEVRRRARQTSSEFLSSANSTWKTTDSLVDYIAAVSKPAIDNARLRESSQKRYSLVLKQLVGDCQAHRHRESLRGHSIASGTTFRTMENALREIAELHGPETAHQARSVLSKYVVAQLKRDNLVSADPIKGESLDLGPKQPPQRGGKSLSREEYNRVVDHLLSIDPSEGIENPKRGRWKLEDRVAKRRNAIDLTLLQAATGLRIGEATSITWRDVEIADNGAMQVEVTAAISKTHRGRHVPVLDGRVAARILERRNSSQHQDERVIGSPADPAGAWDGRNCTAAVADLYLLLAEQLDIPLLKTARSHVWRATLNSLLLDSVPEVVRTAFFGHNAATSRAHYTDLSDTSGMRAAARQLRAV
ncbi:tyrosine-type recombinase/integrase [Nesterenkonia sp. Act20]|uniref:tyrosine-type recombinase/integrase n=1 Tax=Nesterenkonia sp. Act20 TaxID=1483432 RepID=UPI001C4505CA|nr:tyrosine-type recombinase/integrase [Nesterenkonia sp. Act20]